MKPFNNSIKPALIAGLLFAASANGATYTTTPTADAFVTNGSLSGANPAKNYGSTGALMVAGPDSANGTFETLLKFNLSAAKLEFDAQYGSGNWMVSEIKLTLAGNFAVQGAQPNNPIFPMINAGGFSIGWLANDNWAEGTGSLPLGSTDGVTFNSLLSLSGASDEALGGFAFTAPGNNVQSTYVLGNGAGFVADIASGSDVSLLLAPTDRTVGYLFNSRTYGTAANRPQLTLTAVAVPEPSSVVFLMAGIASLAAVGRTNKGR